MATPSTPAALPATTTPSIPVGVATLLGAGGGVSTLILAGIALFTDRSAESIGAFGSAAALLIATVLGRMLQAKETIRVQGTQP